MWNKKTDTFDPRKEYWALHNFEQSPWIGNDNIRYIPKNKIVDDILTWKKLQLVKTEFLEIIDLAIHHLEGIYHEDGTDFIQEILFRPKNDSNIQVTLSIIRNLGLSFDLFKKNIKTAASIISESWNKEKVSINAYSEDLAHPKLLDSLNEVCTNNNIPPWNIVIEILEYQFWDHNISVLENLKKLQETWYKIAIDDWFHKSNSYQDENNYSSQILELIVSEWIKVDYLKACWKFIQHLSSLGKTSREKHFTKAFFKEFKNINELKDTIIIGEWTDSLEHITTAWDIWCNMFQSRDIIWRWSEGFIHKKWDVIPFRNKKTA